MVPSGQYLAMSPVLYQRIPSCSTKRCAVRSGSLRYPAATFAPPTQSSPGTQSRQSRPDGETTRQRTLRKGTPNGTVAQCAGGSPTTSQMVLWMAVSVAPPRPENRLAGTCLASLRAKSAPTQSPPRVTARNESPSRSPPSSKIMSSMLGTQFRIETLCRRSNSTQVVASAFCRASIATREPPAENMPKMS